MNVGCGAICLIALFVALSVQERSAGKRLAPWLPCAHLLTDLGGVLFFFCAIYRFLDEIVTLATNDLASFVWLNVAVPFFIGYHEKLWPLPAAFGAKVRIEDEGDASFLIEQFLPLSHLFFSKSLLVYLWV
jgi:hypothetical protein